MFCKKVLRAMMEQEAENISARGIKGLTITVVCDNNLYTDGLETAWGFGCFIAGPEKTILFDTGGNGSLLLSNMEKLAIEANRIDIVVLSHIHPDHTGGLDSFLEENPGVSIYLLESFPKRFKDKVQAQGAKIVEVKQPLKICENVWSTGQLGKWIKEQSLIIRTEAGLVVITGCAHPGIVKIVNPVRSSPYWGTDAQYLTSNGVNAVEDLVREDILLVMGGFHLKWAGKGKIEKVISVFKQLGVRYVGLCHGSGDKARSLFEEHFGKNYIKIGAGKVITLADLQ